MALPEWLKGPDMTPVKSEAKPKPGFTGVGIRPEDIDTEADGSPCLREEQPVTRK